MNRARHAAGGGARLGACLALLAGACGARTGIDWQLLAEDEALDARGADGGADGAGGACWPASLDLIAGNNCTAGEQLLQCIVAASGDTTMPNYCVTSMPGCAAMEGESACQSQCNAGEFGIECGQSTVPLAAGCRIVFPLSPSATEGLAFCCTCQ